MAAQRANPNIAMTISELVIEGMLDSYEICQVLKHYVTVAMCASTMTLMIQHTIQLFLIYKTMFIKLKRLLTYQNLINKISNKLYFRLFVKIKKLQEEFIDDRTFRKNLNSLYDGFIKWWSLFSVLDYWTGLTFDLNK